jgi:hypothetical protein
VRGGAVVTGEFVAGSGGRRAGGGEGDLLVDGVAGRDDLASASGVAVEKAPAGALALVMTSGTVPVLVTSNVLVARAPTLTCPKSSVVGVIVSVGVPVTATPRSGTTTVPASPVTVSDPLSGLPANEPLVGV